MVGNGLIRYTDVSSLLSRPRLLFKAEPCSWLLFFAIVVVTCWLELFSLPVASNDGANLAVSVVVVESGFVTTSALFWRCCSEDNYIHKRIRQIHTITDTTMKETMLDLCA